FSGRALLVDDRREPQRVMTFMLERLGLDVEVADLVDLAADRAATGRFDVILLARSMLRKDEKLAKRLRQNGVAAPLLAILDADAAPSQETWCGEIGCDTVLRLPLTPAQLAVALAHYVSEAPADMYQADAAPLVSRHQQAAG